jgi:hypothetical protein
MLSVMMRLPVEDDHISLGMLLDESCAAPSGGDADAVGIFSLLNTLRARLVVYILAERFRHHRPSRARAGRTFEQPCVDHDFFLSEVAACVDALRAPR